jgi:hypothetical protein
MEQVARNLTDAASGALLDQRLLLPDRVQSSVRDAVDPPHRWRGTSEAAAEFSESDAVRAERWVRSLNEECLSPVRRGIASPRSERIHYAVPPSEIMRDWETCGSFVNR